MSIQNQVNQILEDLNVKELFHEFILPNVEEAIEKSPIKEEYLHTQFFQDGEVSISELTKAMNEYNKELKELVCQEVLVQIKETFSRYFNIDMDTPPPTPEEKKDDSTERIKVQKNIANRIPAGERADIIKGMTENKSATELKEKHTVNETILKIIAEQANLGEWIQINFHQELTSS